MQHMLTSYCRHHHGKDRLCVGCLELRSYLDRVQPRCPSAQRKVSCQNCQKECLPAWVRTKLRQVGRQELPHLAWRHPILALKYWLLARRQPAIKPMVASPNQGLSCQ